MPTRILARRIIFFPFPPHSLQVLEVWILGNRGGDDVAAKPVFDLAQQGSAQQIP